jgi:hypothetical protein
MARKIPERRPKTRWIRSKSGTPARVVRTSKRSSEGLWLYRLDYGCVSGSARWTLPELEDLELRWLKNRPKDWGDR